MEGSCPQFRITIWLRRCLIWKRCDQTLRHMIFISRAGLAAGFWVVSLAGHAAGAVRLGAPQPNGTEVAQAASSASARVSDPKASFARGQAALQRGDLDRAEAAFREVKEETGYDVCMLGFAGAVAYRTEKGSKIVRFWNMTVSREGQSGMDTSEVSEVAWLSPPEAIDRLSYPLEKAMVEAWQSEIARPKAPVAIPT